MRVKIMFFNASFHITLFKIHSFCKEERDIGLYRSILGNMERRLKIINIPKKMPADWIKLFPKELEKIISDKIKRI